MQGRQLVNDVLKTLSIRDGVPELSLDIFDCVGIQLKDQTHFQIELNQALKSVATYFSVGSVEQFSLNKADLFESLLQQNNSPFSGKFILNEQANLIYLVDVVETSDFSVSYLDNLIAQNLDTIKRTSEQLAARAEASAESSKYAQLTARTQPPSLQREQSSNRFRSTILKDRTHA